MTNIIRKIVKNSGIEIELEDQIVNPIKVNILLENIQNNKSNKIILISNKTNNIEKIDNKDISNVLIIENYKEMCQWDFVLDTTINNEIIKFDIIDENNNNIISDITIKIFYLYKN